RWVLREVVWAISVVDSKRGPLFIDSSLRYNEDGMSKRIGFIGAGNMAQALIAGLLRGGTLPEAIRIVDPEPTQREKVRAAYGVSHSDDATQLATWADVLILAVKPQVAATVLQAVAPTLSADKLLISVCAGLSLATVESHAGTAARYVRSMPNTPALVGEGATA